MEEIATGSMVTTVAETKAVADAPQCARAPVGLLAELTHRCPLQCPYCSNPLELTRVAQEMTTAQWQEVMRQAGEFGSPPAPPLRRRTVRASGSRADPRSGREGRPVHQPHHLGRDADPRPAGGACADRSRSRSAFDPGRRSRQRRQDLGLQGRVGEEARGGQVDQRTRPAAHAQRRRAPSQHREPAAP